MEWSGLAETAYRSGIKELIDKGYLVNTKGNNYTFFETNGIDIETTDIYNYKRIDKKELDDVFDF